MPNCYDIKFSTSNNIDSNNSISNYRIDTINPKNNNNNNNIVKCFYSMIVNFNVFILCNLIIILLVNFNQASATINLISNSHDPGYVDETSYINSNNSNTNLNETTVDKQQLHTSNSKPNTSSFLNENIQNVDFYTKYKLIVLYAFDRSFKLNLKLIPNSEFLSPNLKFLSINHRHNKNNNEYLTNSINDWKQPNKTSKSIDCFYRGIVDDDLQSFAYINLCHKGHVIGSFSLNNTDYFIEPIEEFDSAKFDNKEFSFVDFDLNNRNGKLRENTDDKNENLPLTTHLIYTESNYFNASSTYTASCALDDNNAATDDTPKNKTKNRRVKRKAASSGSQYSVIDRRLYLELLVVVDKKMYEYYESNLENHILTLMFMVTQMYQHSSLINPIRVYVTDIIYLHKLEEKSKNRTIFETEWEAEKTLNKFCEWQHEYKKDANIRDKVDATILITKTDICKSKNICQTLGMARLNQICVSGQSCAVIEDSGINTAYTIAHEIGHLLGMKHVDEERCKGIDNKTTQMMASMLDLTKKSHAWSNCSVDDLNSFLRTGDAECLFNVPEKNPNFFNRSLKFEDITEQFDERTILNALYPGSLQVYEIKHQCQQIFGPRSDACEQNLDDDCKILWCKLYDLYSDVAVHCVTTNTKWADGTACGLSEYNTSPKICMNGECVSKSDIRAIKEDGQWGSWSEFTPCSRSCGGGVRKRYRACDNPKPKNGGKYCVGDRYHYESCNIQDCRTDEVAFRDEQCRIAAQEISPQKMRDQMGFSTNNTFLWKAYYSHDPRRKCILFCKLEDRPNFAMLRPMVTDGTKCGLNTYDICVNGHCLPAGCDNILYSNKHNDNCGICDGGNKMCRETSYTIETPNNFGYNKLSTIPSKSTNVFIHRQRVSDDLGCLVIRSASSFLLNGHYVISKTSTSIKFDGKIIDYIVNDTDEIIKSPGNFSQHLEIQFLAGSKKIYNSIKFTYYTPINGRKPIGNNEIQRNKPIYSYESNEHRTSMLKQEENKIEILQRDKYKIPELFEKNSTRVGQCDKLCNGVQIVYLNRCKKSGDLECKSTQLETRSCNTECDLRVLASQGRCTPVVGDCGHGKMDIKVECIKIDKINNVTRSVDLFHCDSNEVKSVYDLYKSSKCYLPCDNFDWKLADSTCSCEYGFKKQNYQCHDTLTNEVVNESKCQTKPKPKQDRIKCDVYCYKWQSSYWSECSKSCATGVRYRKNYCIFNASKIVDDSYCKSPENPTPPEYEYCNTEECPKWSSTPWSQCSTPCGQMGKRQRRVTCVYKNVEVDNSKCYNSNNNNNRPPADTEECRLECEGQWQTSEWSECSATCEKGFKTRMVYCQVSKSQRPQIDEYLKNRNRGGSGSNAVFNESMCNLKQKPTNVSECVVEEKCPKWILSSWSACKGPCGQGVMTRTVVCSGGSKGAQACNNLKKPSNYENCTVKCAARWKAENWTECNGDCNFGWKFRVIRCVDENENTVSSSECSDKDKPERRQRCISCSGIWKSGPWNKCSNPCGKGIQSRNVECRMPLTNELVSNSKCSVNNKPAEQRTCEDSLCHEELTFDWHIVSKGECSVTCGLGWRLRRFECKSNRNESSPDRCKPETQPEYYEKCDAGECPKWQYGAWSTCSTECGDGVKRRLVVCVGSNGLVTEDKFCDKSERPQDYQKCAGQGCARWATATWSDCDFKTCTKVRSVYCALENGTRLSESTCNKSDKPNYIAECDSRASCNHYLTNLVLNQNNNENNQDYSNVMSVGYIHYTQWSSCSAKCGPGWRSRRAICKSVSNDSIELDLKFCPKDGREPLRIACNLAECDYRIIEKWSQCSSSCGQQGLETLERTCFDNMAKKFVNLANCGISNVTRGITRTCYRPCVRHVRLAYEWRATDWKNCSAKCGFGYKNRSVYCWNQYENRKADEVNCLAKNKPALSLPCMNVSCGYGWFVSEWSPCTKNCSTGFKSRDVICAKVSKEGHILNITSNRCRLSEKPLDRISCNYGDCGGNYFWQPGHWSKCVPNCGFGYQKRILSCIDRFGNVQNNSQRCNQNTMPIMSQFCFTNCHMQSCSRLRSTFGITKDAEYNLKLSNKIVSIYCKDMNTTKPKEFITLKSGESQNFAQIYDRKLLEPSKCRIGPKYNGICQFCKNETLENHGMTLFSKVRLNIKVLTIIEDDFSFANVIYGNPVPFGHSGDCYSSLPECQHGRLYINFKGTGFVLDNDVKWVNYGEKSHSNIIYSKDNSSVYGTCGGLCGFCKPDPLIGMKLRVL